MNESRAKGVIESVRDVYNALTHFSDTRHSLWEEQKFFRNQVSKGDTIVDVGCGNGRLLQLFPNFNVTYIGIDNSAKLLEKAQQYAKNFEHATTTFFESSLLSLPVNDASADSVFCIASLHHIPSYVLQKKALEECFRILKPGGTLCMTNWYLSQQRKYVWMQVRDRFLHPTLYRGFGLRDFLIPWHTKEKTYRRFYYAFSPREIEQLLDEVGFISISQSISHGAKDWSGKRKKRNIITIAKKSDGTRASGN